MAASIMPNYKRRSVSVKYKRNWHFTHEIYYIGPWSKQLLRKLFAGRAKYREKAKTLYSIFIEKSIHFVLKNPLTKLFQGYLGLRLITIKTCKEISFLRTNMLS